MANVLRLRKVNETSTNPFVTEEVGRNYINEGRLIFDIFDSFRRIIYEPIACFIASFLFIVYLVEFVDEKNKPLETWSASLNKNCIIADKVPRWEKFFCHIGMFFLNISIKHKRVLFGVLLLSVPIICRPSLKNLIAGIFLTTVFMLMRTWSEFEFILIALAFYVYVMSNSITTKFLMFLTIIFLISSEYILELVHKKTGSSDSKSSGSTSSTPSKKLKRGVDEDSVKNLFSN